MRESRDGASPEVLARIRTLEKRLEKSTQAYEQLTRSVLRDRDLIEHLVHEVHVWDLVRDPDGAIKTWRLVYANRAALAAWKRKLGDVAGLTADEMFPDSRSTELFLPIVEKIFADGTPFFWEQKFPATGQTLQMVSIPLGDSFISTGLDISEQIQQEAELKQLQKMEGIGQLVGGVTHDFNNQLAGIIGNAELLESALAGTPHIDAVKAILSCAQRSTKLTSQLLAFGRKGSIKQETLAAIELVHDTVALLRLGADHGTTIGINDLTGGASFVVGDATLLQSAILNLGLNARDATKRGDTISIAITVIKPGDALLDRFEGLRRDCSFVCIAVSDTGAGINDEAKAHLFEPFFTTKKHGTGMGLAMAHETIRRHNGDLLVDSVVGEGTCFRVLLPLVAAPESSAIAPGTDSETNLPPLCVLVVDDEPAVRELCATMLSQEGHEVLMAGNGEEACTCYTNRWRQIDVVFLDMNMPGMGGLEAFRAMKSLNPEICAVLFSGLSTEESLQTASDAGVKAVLQKPFRKSELIGAMSRAFH